MLDMEVKAYTMKTLGGREMNKLQAMFVEMATLFYAHGLSVSEMIQGSYEAQLSFKRSQDKPAQINIKERNNED